jgi:copper transport protein
MTLSHNAAIRLKTLGWALVLLLFLIGAPLLWAASPLVLGGVVVAGALFGLIAHWLHRLFKRHALQSGSGLRAMMIGAGLLTGLVAAPGWWLVLQPALHPLAVPRVTLSDGTRHVVFQGMVHVGSEQFYRSVSYDLIRAKDAGHPVGGSLVFSIGEVTSAALEAPSEPGAVPAVVARAGFVLALVLSVGAAVFHHAVAPLSARSARLPSLMAGFVLPLGILWIAVEGTERLGLGLGAAFSVPSMQAGLQSPVLFTVILAALAAPLVFGALQAGSRWAAVGALGLSALSFAVSGHSLSAPSGLGPVLTALHAGAIILWVGGLIPLALAMRGGDRLMVLRRFSSVALPAVVVLIVSGAALALLHRGSAGLLSSDWARLLAVKLGLVAGMLVLALWHRLRAMPRLALGTEVPVRRSVAVEAGLGLAVLMLAMGFRLAPPPSAAAPLPDPVAIHIHTDQAMVDLAATAPFPGPTGFRLGIADGDFVPFDPKEVTFSLTDDVAGIGPLTASAVRTGPGLWEVEPLTLPTPGPWQVRIALLVTDFEQVRLTGTLPAPLEQDP